MRAVTVRFVVALALVLIPVTSAAQEAAPPPAVPPSTGAGPATTSAGSPSAATPAPEASPLPPPVAGTVVDVSGSPTGVPNPTAAPASGDDWKFFTHGYFRAPLRVGMGKRPACGANQKAGTMIPVGTAGTTAPCAGPGQSTTNLHSPFLPDDQYLDWRYTRQWEQDWTEVFLNYGNSHVVGTVGLQAYNLTDAGYNDSGAQLGIAQGFVTVTPDIGLSGVRLKWKVGSFWEKYGQAGQYDAGPYDTYMFGRIHQIGEALSAEADVGDFTIKAAQGIGAKLEQVAAGNAPTAGQPGFTLLTHYHAGVAYKKIVDANLHYLASWAQDARATPTSPDGKIDVVGGEVRLTGGLAGTLYGAYSHVSATDAGAVGPAIEVIHSLGGGNHQTGNGLIDNYLGTCAKCAAADVGNGGIDTVEIAYNYSFGLLWRKLKDPNANFWGDGTDLTLGLYGMYTAVSSKDTDADGVKKLKYGADLVFRALSWVGIGARADIVQPSSKNQNESFWVVSPKVIFRTAFVTHEEITAQYSHYTYKSEVTPQPPNNGYPPDENVFGIKATMWW